jgi:hypothetical protein
VERGWREERGDQEKVVRKGGARKTEQGLVLQDVSPQDASSHLRLLALAQVPEHRLPVPGAG